MIEDKKLGLKVAENPEEALWTKVKNTYTEEIKVLEEGLIVSKQFLKVAERMIREAK